MSAAAYFNSTTHTRFVPFRRSFRQRVFQLFLDVDRVDDDLRGLKLITHNRPGLFAFYDKDHGDRSGKPLRSWVEETLAKARVPSADGPVRLLCFPRLFNFVFNPISIFFVYDQSERLRAVLYEVNNTFGQSHCYAAGIDAPDAPGEHNAPKNFHVSPLQDTTGEYVFRLRTPGERFSLAVENREGDQTQHLATLSGASAPLTDATLFRAFCAMPFMTLAVVLGIHWHALHIWLRGVRYRKTPPPPAAPVTRAHTKQVLADA